VTVYGYLTHVPATGWGTSWVSGGGAEVRFRTPVLDGDLVECAAVGGGLVEARVAGSPRASCAFVDAAGPLPFRSGEPLVPIEVVVDEDLLDVGLRSGDDCPIYVREGIAHPSVWPKLANRFFHQQLVSGAWIHVRSRIAHHGIARLGSTLTADANVIERFDSRAGRRAIADVAIRADGSLVATLEHEAIIEVA
jgi:acyl dehydratase